MESTYIQSSSFKDPRYVDANSGVVFITNSQTINAEVVTLGEFRLSPSQIDRLNNFQDVTLSSELPQSFSSSLKNSFDVLSLEQKNIYVVGNTVYISKGHHSSPQVGDIRITFSKVPCDWVSNIAQQAGNTFVPYNVKERRFRKKSDSERARLIDEENRSALESLKKVVIDAARLAAVMLNL